VCAACVCAACARLAGQRSPAPSVCKPPNYPPLPGCSDARRLRCPRCLTLAGAAGRLRPPLTLATRAFGLPAVSPCRRGAVGMVHAFIRASDLAAPAALSAPARTRARPLPHQLLEQPRAQPAVSEGTVLPSAGVKQQTTMLMPYGMLPRASRHFFSDGERPDATAVSWETRLVRRALRVMVFSDQVVGSR